MSDDVDDPVELDVESIVEVLNRHGVRYVIVGGVAAQTWAASVGVNVRPTTDLDVTPSTDAGNLERLSAALYELGARVRTVSVPGGLALNHSGASLGGALMWNLVCPAGAFDVVLVPAGTEGYEDLARRARVVTIGAMDVPLADLIRSKRAANRPKDLETLTALEEALRRRESNARSANPAPEP